MADWTRCPARADPNDSLPILDEILAVIENAAIEVGDKLPANHVKDQAMIRRAFDGFADAISDAGGGGGGASTSTDIARAAPSTDRNGGLECEAANCTNGEGGKRSVLPSSQNSAVQKSGVARNHVVCTGCFTGPGGLLKTGEQLMRDGTKRYSTGRNGGLNAKTKAYLAGDWYDGPAEPEVARQAMARHLSVTTKKDGGRRSAKRTSKGAGKKTGTKVQLNQGDLAKLKQRWTSEAVARSASAVPAAPATAASHSQGAFSQPTTRS